MKTFLLKQIQPLQEKISKLWEENLSFLALAKWNLH